MKSLKYIIILIIPFAFILACDNKLDIEPVQSVEAEKLITTSEGVINLLHGAYSGLKGTAGTNEGGELYGGHFNFISEELADDGDASFIGTFQEHRDLFAKNLTTDHAYALATWLRAYDVINMVNIVLDKINIVEESERERVRGEALCIRGMLYFELVRFWGAQWETAGANDGPGVPIRLIPTYAVDDAYFIPRSTVAEVYTQAISDLTEAETLLGSFGNDGVGVNTYTASAYLSRIYLQQSQFEEAALAADRVISSNLFTLVDVPIKEFNQLSNTKEDIFAIQQSTISNAGTSNSGLATHYACLEGQGRGDIIINQQHIDSYELGDLRGGVQMVVKEEGTFLDVDTMFYIGNGSDNSGNINIVKWADPTKNIPVIRLAEMYLTRAEGNFEAGTTHGATPLDDINMIRRRAGLTDLTGLTQDNIRNERRLELAYEGFALHDIRRWHLNIGTLTYDDPSLVLPIPQREIDVNPEMEQNEGY